MCQAKSGMGKTAVFVLATLHQLNPQPGEVRLVLFFQYLRFYLCGVGAIRMSLRLSSDLVRRMHSSVERSLRGWANSQFETQQPTPLGRVASAAWECVIMVSYMDYEKSHLAVAQAVAHAIWLRRQATFFIRWAGEY